MFYFRQHELNEWKSENLITPSHLIDYGRSDHIQKVIKRLDNLQNGTLDIQIMPIKDLTEIRDYLMTNLVVINGARASNIMNIETKHVLESTYDEEYEAYVFKSTKYKTSLVYGAKIMVLPRDLYNSLKTFIEKVHPVLSGKSDYLFTSSRTKDKMDHSMLSNALSTSFRLAGINERISCSRLRCAVVTDLVGISGEDCDAVAQHFMKHRPSTSRKFYINRWATIESMRIAMKCHSRFIDYENTDGVIKIF